MSTDGIQQQYIPASLDGLVYVDVDGLTVNGVPVDLNNLVPYTNATKNLNLGTFNFETLGAVSAKQHVFPPFTSTLMTGAMTSSIFTADAWQFSNTISTVSLGPTVSTSYLTLNDITNNSTIVTFQSDGIANFESTIVRTNRMAVSNFDVVNLSTLTSAVAFIENVNALNYVPYTGATNNLNMGASTITTTGLIHAGALRITSSIVNTDYSVSVNGTDFLEFTNLTTSQKIYTDGGSLWLPGNVYNNGIVYSNELQLSGTSYLGYGTIYQYGTSINGSGRYEIADDTGNGILTLSKANGLTISTITITQVPSATPTYALGVNGSGGVVSFAVPTASNILPLDNIFTGTNTFNSTMTTGVGYTTSINGALTTSLVDLGFTSASFTTAGITGTYSPPLGTITNVSGSTYQIAQTAQGRSIMAISGFTPSVGITYVFSFNIKCTIGTATISVEQDNIVVSPALYPLTTGFNRVVGSFTYNGTPNTVVFKIYTGVASWNAQWDSFTLSTYSIGMNANMNALTVNNRFTQRYNALTTDVSTLVNRATMDSAISAGSIVNLNNTFIGTNAFNNDVSLGVSTVVVNQQSITTSILQTAGISSQALGGTAVISGSYLLTPTPTTFAYASVYSPTQTFLANAKYNYLFTGFTAGIFGVSLTVYQANVANTGFVAISSTVPVVVGTFSGIFTPNVNSSYLGQVYFTFSGINSKTVGWTTFTYQRGMETVNGNLTVNGDTILGTTTTSGIITKTGTTAGNDIRIEGGTTTNSGYVNFVSGGTSRGYIGNANSTDMIINAQNGAKLNFYTAGANRMTINTVGQTDLFGNLAINNGTTGTLTKYGNTAGYYMTMNGGTNANSPYLEFFSAGSRKMYIGNAGTNVEIAAENGAYLNIMTNGSNRINVQSTGLVVIQNGLSVANNEIICANQPFVIVGAVGGASIGYGVGTNFGSGGYLYAYTSAGYSNTPGSGWASNNGRFWATKAGRYQVNFCFYWNNFAGGSRAVMNHYNSVGVLQENRYCALWASGIGSDTTQNYSTIVYMLAGSWLEFQFQTGSGTLYFGGITHTHCSFHFIC
jgi:hypothetical protein